MNKRKIELKNCLELFPLRIAITDYCNLQCFFCSNEGMPFSQKNKTHINVKQLNYLIKNLVDKGLKNVSITGGDPTLHPKIFEIIDFLNQFNFKNLFFHTNGINLNKNLIKKLSKKANKIAVSMHSANLDTWQKMTGGTKSQFKKLISSLELLSNITNNNLLVELKSVLIRGYNDSEKELKDFLELCNIFGFKFKFLNFEPIIPEHIRLVLPFGEVKRRLINIGCRIEEEEKEFRGQCNYLPIKKFRYRDVLGVAIKIGCGEPKVCRECYRSNEIFITSEFQIKPCHIDDYQINLGEFIKKQDEQAIFKAIIASRLFLACSPRSDSKLWQNNKSSLINYDNK